jgi:hypothetical protein
MAQGAVSLGGQKVSDAQLKLELRSGEQILVRAGKLKLERWVVR